MVNTQRHGRDSSGAAAADEYQEAVVVNITDEPVEFLVGTGPNGRPRRYKFAPHGKPGDRNGMPMGYALPYEGAGRQMCTPIVERLSMRHVHDAHYTRNEKGESVRNESPRLPMVVHIDKVRTARAQWLAAIDRAPAAVRRLTERAPVARDEVQRDAAPAPAELIGEEVSQDEIEPPHPDDVDDVVADGPPPGDDVETPPRKPRGGRS